MDAAESHLLLVCRRKQLPHRSAAHPPLLLVPVRQGEMLHHNNQSRDLSSMIKASVRGRQRLWFYFIQKTTHWRNVRRYPKRRNGAEGITSIEIYLLSENEVFYHTDMLGRCSFIDQGTFCQSNSWIKRHKQKQKNNNKLFGSKDSLFVLSFSTKSKVRSFLSIGKQK